MNIFHRITLATLRKNKVRTTVTVIGIVLSAAMFCAVTTFLSSLQNFLLENMIYRDGSWHGSAIALEWADMERIAGAEEIDEWVYSQQIGYAKLDDPQNERRPYLYLLGAGEGFEKMMPVHLVAGTYPTSSQELLLPDHLLEYEGQIYSIGDVLTLEVGSRISDDGEELRQETPNYRYDDNGNVVSLEEEFVPRETRSYTVVGFYEAPGFEPYNAPGYTALTLADSAPVSGTNYDLYFTMDHPKAMYDFMLANNLYGNQNTDVLMTMGVSRYDNFYTVLYGLAGIITLLILFGSVSLIYNAFSISVSERTKQFGLLSSVGATRRQLRSSVLFEAFAVSVVGIPIGILVGIGGIGITLLCVGSKFSSVVGFSVPMRLCVSPLSVLVACAIALITVLISAWIPSKRATRVTAVEAIRQNADVKMDRPASKTSGLSYRLFGLPGMLAGKHYRRSRKKYRSTVLSLFMSIVLFVSASAFTGYLTDSVEGGFSDLEYDLEASVDGEDLQKIGAETLFSRMLSDEGITGGTYMQTGSLWASISLEYLNPDMSDWFEVTGSSAEQSVQIYFLRDEDFLALLRENGLSEALFYNPQSPLAVAMDSFTLFRPDKERYETVRLLKGNECEAACYVPRSVEGYTYRYRTTDENGVWSYVYSDNDDSEKLLELSRDEACDKRVFSSGVTLSEPPELIPSTEKITFIYPQSFAQKLLPEWMEWNNVYTYLFTSENHKISFNALKSTLTENGIASNSLIDYAESDEQSRNIVTIVRVFSYGFIVLISLIAAANVFNTISTNISLRRREFAMLKSVGMTSRGFNRMMNYECLLYGSKALLWGLPISCLVTYLIYRVVNVGYETTFRLPWAALGIATLSVFAVVFATMMYAMRKMKRDNPIDALKNENL